MRALIWPGLQLQKLTTREPDDSMLEAAIAALKPVLVADGIGVEPQPVVAGRAGVSHCLTAKLKIDD